MRHFVVGPSLRLCKEVIWPYPLKGKPSLSLCRWRRHNLKVKVFPANVALSSLPRDFHCFTVAYLSLVTQQAFPLLPLPFPHMESLWLRQRCTHVHFFSEVNPFYTQVCPRKPLWGNMRYHDWYLILPKKAFYSPKWSMRTHKKPGLFGIVAWLLGKARCHSGHSMSMVQDLPPPAVSIYMGVLPDLLNSGPYFFLTWLTHFLARLRLKSP